VQIFFFPTEITLLIIFLLWPTFQLSASSLCVIIGDGSFSKESWLYRSKKWERDGELFNTLFKIRRWKRFLPDGASIIPGAFRKKHLGSFSEENLEKFLVESRRAELGHWLAIIPFWVFGFFGPPIIILYMLIYALIINLPCILAQRYNRPRIIKILEDKERMKEKNYELHQPI